MITLNPPPKDGRCYRCNKLKPLRKTFRTHYKGTDNEQTSASWECEDCINLETEE